MDQEVLVASFLSLAPKATMDEAVAYLAIANNEVDAAVAIYLSESSSAPPPTVSQPEKTEPPQQKSPQPAVVQPKKSEGQQPQQPKSSDVKQPAHATPQAANKPPPKQATFYTGGADTGSGQAVAARHEENESSDFFSELRRSGANDIRQFNARSTAFQGAGRRVGHTPDASPPIAPDVKPTRSVTLTFYRNGFVVDDGPLRDPAEPSNAEFFREIMAGRIPKELQDKYPNIEIELHVLDCREADRPTAPRFVAFHGEGKTLGGSDGPRCAPQPSAAAHIVMQDGMEQSAVMLQLPDGSRTKVPVNPTIHTVEMLYGTAATISSLPLGSFTLQARDIPPRNLVDMKQTLDAAGLRNSTVVVRKS